MLELKTEIDWLNSAFPRLKPFPMGSMIYHVLVVPEYNDRYVVDCWGRSTMGVEPTIVERKCVEIFPKDKLVIVYRDDLKMYEILKQFAEKFNYEMIEKLGDK